MVLSDLEWFEGGGLKLYNSQIIEQADDGGTNIPVV